MKVAAVVLAGGEGRRFGGPKQLALIDGRPLVEHAIGAAAGLPTFVVLGAYAERIAAGADLGAARVVVAHDWAEGQAASLRAGVAAAGDVDAVVVLLADMPFVTPEAVAGALAQFHDCDAVRTLYGGEPGHPVVLGRSLLAQVPSLRGDVGARELMRSARVRTWEAGDLADPSDIDTPEQLEVRAR